MYLREVEVIQEVYELAVSRWTEVGARLLLQWQSHRVLFQQDQTDTEWHQVLMKSTSTRFAPFRDAVATTEKKSAAWTSLYVSEKLRVRVLFLTTSDAHLKDGRCRVEVEVDGLERYFIRILHLKHTHDHLRGETKHEKWWFEVGHGELLRR